MTTAEATPDATQRWLRRVASSDSLVLLLCLLAFATFAPIAPGFATTDNAWNILISCLPLLVLATGQTLVLITGGIDLSMPALIGLASVVGSLVMGGDQGWLRGSEWATATAMGAMLGTGAAVGFLNGACIAWLRMPPFMVTLTSAMFFQGFAVWLAKKVVNAESVYNLPAAFLVFGHQGWLAVLLGGSSALLAHLLLSRTLLGRWFYAIGHNPQTSLVSGVPVRGATVSAYVLSGLFAAGAAILLTARLETGSPNHGRSLLLDVIGAAVIGGTSLFGGKGKVLWTIYGVAFLSILGNGLNLLNLSDFVITMVKGGVILAAALLDVGRTKLLRAS